LVAISFAIVSTVGDGSSNTLCFDSRLSLLSPTLHDVTFHVIEFVVEADNSNSGALESFLISPKPFPKE